jgi:hypothetical protein
MSGLDLTAHKLAETTFVHFKGPDHELLYYVVGDEKHKVGATVYSTGTREYQRAKTKQNNRFTERLKKKKQDQSTDERLAEEAEFYADVTAELHHVAYEPAANLQGKAFMKAIYAEPALNFLLPQIDEVLGDTENFTGPSPKN